MRASPPGKKPVLPVPPALTVEHKADAQVLNLFCYDLGTNSSQSSLPCPHGRLAPWDPKLNKLKITEFL
jgi:hypothetical protein